MTEELERIFEEMQELAKVGTAQYRGIVNDVINKKITDEREIEHILDGMLDFCLFDEMLLLFKQLCRELLPRYPQLVYDYISYYHETWGDEQMMKY